MKTSPPVLAALLLALHAPVHAADPNHSSKPNIVIVLGDDNGIMDTSVPFLTDEAGKPIRYPLNEFMHTPNMERLAAQGIRFNNFYAMSVCSPSRVSLLTGQNSARSSSPPSATTTTTQHSPCSSD